MSRPKVYQQIPRIEESLLLELATVPVADAHEVMGRTGLFERGIGPVGEHRRLCGQAVTCLNLPGDNLAVHIGLHLASPGDVLVATATASPPMCCWGDLLNTCAQARGIAGLVTDGYVRDISAIRASGFAVWARGIHAQGATKQDLAGVNVSVCCGGQVVRPGDVILADEDGVVVIPLERASEVVDKALARRTREAQLADSLRQGVSTFDLLDLRSTPGGDRTTWSHAQSSESKPSQVR